MKIATLALAVLMPASASAATLVRHQGSTDPSTEGWYYITSGGNVTTSGGTEITASGEHHYWNTNDASLSGGASWYFDMTSAQFASAWRFQISARVIDSPIVPGYLDVPGTGLIMRDGINYWSFYLGNDFVGPMGNAGTLAARYYLNTRNDYHSYVIAISHNGAGAADDTADFYVDGALAFAGMPRSVLYASTDVVVNFGPNSTNGTSNVNYELVRVDVSDAPGTCSEGGDDDGEAGGDSHDVHAATALRDPEVRVASVRAGGCDAAMEGASPASLLGLAGIVLALATRRRTAEGCRRTRAELLPEPHNGPKLVAGALLGEPDHEDPAVG